MKLFFESTKEIQNTSYAVINKVVVDAIKNEWYDTVDNLFRTYFNKRFEKSDSDFINYVLHESNFKSNIVERLKQAESLSKQYGGAGRYGGPGRRFIGGGTPYSDSVKEQMIEYFNSLPDIYFNRILGMKRKYQELILNQTI